MMDKLLQEALEHIANASSTATLKEVEVSWLGKKGRLTNLLKELGSLAPDERKAKGQALNELKRQIIEAIANRELAVVQAELDAQAMGERLDPTLPGFTPKAGRLHPLTLVIDSVEDVFERMGFHILDYPEAETEFFNFDGLNIPADHPARDTRV